MFARTFGATTLGVDGLIIDVEVDAAAGLPGFDIVGLADALVREAKERVRTAIRNSGIQLRQEKVTINLAPADVRKERIEKYCTKFGLKEVLNNKIPGFCHSLFLLEHQTAPYFQHLQQ